MIYLSTASVVLLWLGASYALGRWIESWSSRS
jgi:hypothetical protein